jgi:2-iminobutanoate/2-iminopropanoate deaminase
VRKLVRVLSPKVPLFPGTHLTQMIETDNYIFSAGMALDTVKHRRMDSAVTIADETRICLESIQEKLRAIGSPMSDVVRTTVLINDPSYETEMDQEYSKFWPPDERPIRTVLIVGIASDCRVEIDAISVSPHSVPAP